MGGKILAQLERLAFYWQKRSLEKKLGLRFLTPYFGFFHLEDKTQRILSLYRIRWERIQGKRIVLVTGCFDLLHREHLNFLKKARKEGNLLVVGLESDRRIKQMKGEGRPVNPWQLRAKNLLRLPEVDFVIKLPDDFGRRTVRLKTLRLIKPHILAISSDDPLERKKREECRIIDCQTKVVYPYNPRISTTKLLLDRVLTKFV